jgi:hypothetical protein
MSLQIVETDWIAIRPSNTSLFLTLALPLAAALVLFALDISQMIRLALLCVLLLVTVIDVYQVLQKHRRAVVAFRIQRTVGPAEVQEAPKSAARHAAKNAASLQVVLRYRQQAGQAAPLETTGEVLSQTYVSVYFTSVSYRFAPDPSWRRFAPRILAIWPDAIDAESYRQVRVLLRHGL